MLTVKLLVLEFGMLLVYAGVKGLSVGRLVRGDNQTPATNQPVGQGQPQTVTP